MEIAILDWNAEAPVQTHCTKFPLANLACQLSSLIENKEFRLEGGDGDAGTGQAAVKVWFVFVSGSRAFSC